MGTKPRAHYGTSPLPCVLRAGEVGPLELLGKEAQTPLPQHQSSVLARPSSLCWSLVLIYSSQISQAAAWAVPPGVIQWRAGGRLTP